MISARLKIGAAVSVALLLPFLFQITPAEAHPGRTASDGCHYCRTNCDYWGEAWNERHCHGGSTYTPPVSTQTQSVATLKTATAKITSVTDGDTVKASIGGTIYSVRLVGIDTPETVHPTKPVQCFGKEASAYLTSLLEGKTVTLERDGIGDNKDKYDRLLRYIEINSEDINAKMVRDGYAYAYTQYPFERSSQYVSYQNQARENKMGLWASGVCGNDFDTTQVQGATTTTEAITGNSVSAVAGAENTSDDGDALLGGAVIAVSAGGLLWYFLRKRRKSAATPIQ